MTTLPVTRLARRPHRTKTKTASTAATLAALLVTLSGPSPAAGQTATQKPFLPAWETPDEKQPTPQQVFKNATFRNNHPEMYAVTEPPAQPVHFYAEFAPVDAIYYAWFSGWADDFFYAMTEAVSTHEPTVEIGLMVDDANAEQDLRSAIQTYGGDPNHPSYIDMSAWPHYGQYALDSIWVVDSGPYWVLDGTGTLAVVDPRYYFDRTNDDAIPYKLADLLGLTDYRPDLDYEGGNIMSDGNGTCFSTTAHVIRNLPHSQADVEQMLADYLGCEKMIWVERLIGEGTGHIDMFAKMLDPTTIIVGEYEPTQDSENAQLLDATAAMLASETNLDGDPFTVVRIPMPDNSNRSVWRTYTNSVQVNDLIMVPIYTNEQSNEAAALQVYQTVLPGTTVVGIPADEIITAGGAVHCVTRTRPVATHADLEPQLADECGGDWQCVTGCGDLDYTGECVYNHSVYCDNQTDLVVDDCSAQGEVCGWDISNDYVNCVQQGCGTVTAEGECRTVDGVDFAIWCQDSYPLVERCDPQQDCVLDPNLGKYHCSSCQDECQTGDTGCSADALASWTCGEAGDGDDCLEHVYTDCPAQHECDQGTCMPSCTDECSTGDVGCSADALASWACGEAGDGDDCLEQVYTDCPTDTQCQSGECVAGCADECQTGDTGCSADQHASWTCGEAGDGDDCLDRVFSDCPTNTHCDGGECVDGCIDECQTGDTGCSADQQSTWSCAEADDGDDCLDRVFSDCPTNTHCDGGECVDGCIDECTSGQTGCSADGLSNWMCGEAGDGDDCLDRVESACAEGESCQGGECVVNAPSSRSGCGCRIDGQANSRGSTAFGTILGLLTLLGLFLLVARKRVV
jgi:agmatine deiminase